MKYLMGVAVALLVMSSVGMGQSAEVLEVGKFSAAQSAGMFPEDWKPLTFEKIKNHTDYSLVKNSETVVVKAVSHGSSSGVTREITIDPKEYPIVQWRWKVENVLQKGDVTSKDGDDYPAVCILHLPMMVIRSGFLKRPHLRRRV